MTLHAGLGKLPFLSMGTPDMVLSGGWEIYEDQPYWVWTYCSGWKEWVPALQVAKDSTKANGFSSEFATNHAGYKLQLIHEQLGLPEHSLVETRRELVKWHAEEQVLQQHWCHKLN